MSDGPHRSLPLRRHWRQLLERVVTPSFSSGEVVEALYNAIINDLREAPMSQVLSILQGDGQPSLFHENCTNKLEALRRICPGSTAGNILLDCAIEANAYGLVGNQAAVMALENASEAIYLGARNSIEEHYKRKESWSVMNVRASLKAAWNAVSGSELASKIMLGKAARKNKVGLTKRTGLDEGPPL